ncbi:Thyroglobulin [Eumeta japonica]|uniref:Thyroglobulin n=1 Tax=Eumeta variegata TaxID=151549 RepID=A0A4C1SQP3_EUMVA|nr:Thyroglobulin [Eumeta japonica]
MVETDHFGCSGFACFLAASEAGRSHGNLTACQHLRRAEARRSKALKVRVRAPRCDKGGQFETIQCTNSRRNEDCWCVDEYGVEIPGTRNTTKATVKCKEPENCPASACRMFCPSGFARDPQTGCSQCRCRDPCDDISCPNGQSCQLMEVKCKTEPCPPIPTCKKARSLANFCPAEVEYFTPSTGYMCGTPCTHDLECRNMEKCCFTKGCRYNCQEPHNVTTCQQAKALADVLAINEREGRGFVPDCGGPNGMFSPKQCSRNGLVCWCVDPRTGHKIAGTMGAANSVNCEGWENMISRSFMGRSFNQEKCDTNICAAVCEYGFKNDHNNCPTCECSEPCEGFTCAIGSKCEVATDPLCKSGSSLCASWPVCKPIMAYSNPCEIGTPLADNNTNELVYCLDERQSYGREIKSFFDAEDDFKTSRAMPNYVSCPKDYKCTKLHKQLESVCCPAKSSDDNKLVESHQQTSTEEGMKLALPEPKCSEEGNYKERQCSFRKIKVTRAEHRKILEENTIRRMRMLLANNTPKRSKRNTERLKLYRVDDSLLKIQTAGPVMGRSAKVIDMGASKQQALGQLFETDFKKVVPAPKRPYNVDEMVELDVECWCVDSFGTEIPQSRGFNVTDESCIKLRRNRLLDLTCRMGCEYGFNLDPITRCPACQCRDPWDVVCGENEECRIVEVSCDDEYCPLFPLVWHANPVSAPIWCHQDPITLDANVCAYECRTDNHCDGAKRCCSNGCGTQCVLPQMKTACQHLQAIQMHQSSELVYR